MPYVEAGHELAHHGWTHRLPASLSRERGRGDRPRQRLDQAGQRPGRARLPFARLGPVTPFDRAAAEARIQYDSSLMGHDYDCYYARQGDVAELKKPFVRGRETRWSRCRSAGRSTTTRTSNTCAIPNGSIQAGLMNANNVLENFVDDFTYMQEVCPDFGILTYTFHPHVIGRGHRMMMLERLIKQLQAGAATFMTMEDAMKEWLARRQAKAAE
jgi:peptidoglycan/xylan/chitin deacetylase (PgdA/CDA1 family)